MVPFEYEKKKLSECFWQGALAYSLASMHAFIHIYMYIYTFTHTYIDKYDIIHTYVDIYRYKYIHIYIYIYRRISLNQPCIKVLAYAFLCIVNGQSGLV